jgi:hypothetical protein
VRCFALAALFAFSIAGYQQDSDTYAIYSAALRDRKPSVENWKIVNETKSFWFCSKPHPELSATYGPVLDDYTSRNKGKVVLERKFELPAYTLVSPEEWNGRTPSTDLASVSAVGFNSDRTRAAVCYSVGNSAGSSGTCLLLVKRDSNWKEAEENHQGCGFGGRGLPVIRSELTD